MRRLMRWLEKSQVDMPSWANIGEDGVDASELAEDAQKMMFLGNVRYHPKASLKDLSTENLPNWWADYHWAGDDSHREGHIKSFIHSMEHYKA